MVDTNQAAAGAAAGEAALEAVVPVLAPFHPLIALVTTAVIAHFNATKTWPTEEQVRAAVPADYQKLVDVWGGWKPSGDGTLKS
jgi:hypothetical protein